MSLKFCNHGWKTDVSPYLRDLTTSRIGWDVFNQLSQNTKTAKNQNYIEGSWDFVEGSIVSRTLECLKF